MRDKGLLPLRFYPTQRPSPRQLPFTPAVDVAGEGFTISFVVEYYLDVRSLDRVEVLTDTLGTETYVLSEGGR